MGSSYRSRSSHMADMKGKGILYEDDDAPIILMDQDDSLIVSEFSLSLIGKVLNLKKQNVEKLLQKMPSQWGMEDRITANDLGKGKFLLNFTSEEDLSSVLRQGPFHFNFCMFVLVRWEPIVHDDYPWIVPFKVQVIGLALHLWTDTNLRNIGARLGHVHVDSLDVAEGSMLIDVDSRKPLKFSRKVESKDGDEVTIEIKYEKLFKHCSTCGMLTHEKDHCPSSDVRSRLQSQTERPGIFTRMQVPQDKAQYHNFHTEHRPNVYDRQPYGQRMEPARHAAQSRYGEEDRKYAHRTHQSGNLRATHSDRIMRRHNDPNRSNRYGASKGPYDRNLRQTWREKAVNTKRPATVPMAPASTPISSRQIVPYEQPTSTSNNGSHGVIEYQSGRSGEGISARGAKRLASAIVTPSRIDHDMEENVTKRAKELTRSLSFTNLSDHEPVTVPADNQIIGALNDMDIEDNQEDGMMECEGIDEDLLGIDLKEMEEREGQQAASMVAKGPTTSEPYNRGLKHSRQGQGNMIRVRRGREVVFPKVCPKVMD
ncbi:hypothetical protein Bca52824_058546 [Brassica carinata]|uniref:Zinc knuckle CX2CX4HX4C domain-containing protein n=1 Tax=Brassica carinata TaxID=52824 RepID=A0A8X7UHA9_BRACI|nr:hypothetical protein Bca52824_058546 [Brassica carinata]